MNAQILPFPVSPELSPLAFFVQVGPAHQKMAGLYATGRLPAKRVVFDASRFRLGSASGVAHGIAERERFDASGWHLAPEARDEEDEGFGVPVRIDLPGLGRSATRRELELLLTAPGGRRLCSCADRKCCLHGVDDTRRDPRSHAAYQAFKAVDDLQTVPASGRAEYFLRGPLAEASKLARQFARLKPSATEATNLGLDAGKLVERFHMYSRHVDSLLAALENVHEHRFVDRSRAKPITRRAVSPAPKEQRK